MQKNPFFISEKTQKKNLKWPSLRPTDFFLASLEARDGEADHEGSAARRLHCGLRQAGQEAPFLRRSDGPVPTRSLAKVNREPGTDLKTDIRSWFLGCSGGRSQLGLWQK